MYTRLFPFRQTAKVKVILKLTFVFFFLFFCLYSLYCVMTSSWMFPTVFGLRKPDAVAHREFPSAVFRFYQKCRSLKLKLVVMDKNILSSLVGEYRVPWENVTMVSFGVFEAEGIQMEKAEQSGKFRMLGFTNQKPTFGTSAQKHTSCFLFRFRWTTLTISVMVIYKNDGFYSTDVCGEESRTRIYGIIMDEFQTKQVTVNNTIMVVPAMTHSFVRELPFSTYVSCQRWRSPPGLTEEGKAHLQALLHLKEVARTLGKTVFIFSKTLLGWYRDCAFSDVIDEVDMGMFVEDLDKYFLTALQKDPNIDGQVFGKIAHGMHFELKVHGMRINLFLVYRDRLKGTMWVRRMDVGWGRILRLVYPDFGLCSGLFYDSVLYVPCPVVPLLKFEFGKEWAKARDLKSRPLNVDMENSFSPIQLPSLVKDINDPSISLRH
ncbi:ribitol-5-phosphate transferase FKTN-like [Liolophura sinensis]|uniref:ribitol-5-phosphate transferase FKTN-like n=1 Tax=Liolophura sinensis TaxID=3198878 RepID=UPI003158D43A